MKKLPGERNLRVYLCFLHEVIIRARSCAKYHDNHANIETLLDVVHNLPDFLLDWESFDEEIFRDQIEFYDKSMPKPQSMKDLSLSTIFERCCEK